jgi:hypothetical protein
MTFRILGLTLCLTASDNYMLVLLELHKEKLVITMTGGILCVRAYVCV